MNELACWLRLQLTPGLGRVGIFRLVEHFGSAHQAVTASVEAWRRVPGLRRELAGSLPAQDDPRIARLTDHLAALAVWGISWWDADYPPLLRQIPDPPAFLYGRGSRRFGEALAIVGSRRPSPTGREVAEALARAVAARGVTVVSGLARGIDTAAHRGALAVDGPTVAVLGCGIDRAYPAENRSLQDRIAHHGTLLSEYLPGSDPLPGNFPGRNRIISGLSRATLVVEAAVDSGSLITAELALEQGREVLAVPGSIDRPTSAGPNRLLKEGAQPVTEAADILDLFWPDRPCRADAADTPDFVTALDETTRRVWETLGPQPRHIDELVGELGLTAGELSAILLHLELQGGVEQLPGTHFVRTAHRFTSR